MNIIIKPQCRQFLNHIHMFDGDCFDNKYNHLQIVHITVVRCILINVHLEKENISIDRVYIRFQVNKIITTFKKTKSR